MSHTPLPISVHVLTWNSAQTLERCLQSVKNCAEILVIDGGSTDETIAIAESFGARVVPQRFPGMQGKPLSDFGAARNIGLQSASQPWILALDSDEVMSDDALQEIKKAITQETCPGAFLVPRHYVLPDGRRVDRASTYPNERIYFFRKDAVEQWIKPVHERVSLKPGTVLGHLDHGSLAPLSPLSVFTSKLSQYLRIEVEASRGKGWKEWLTQRVLRTLRSRTIASVRLGRIWILQRDGVRLPWKYEMVRFWYAWKLVVMTCPLSDRIRA